MYSVTCDVELFHCELTRPGWVTVFTPPRVLVSAGRECICKTCSYHHILTEPPCHLPGDDQKWLEVTFSLIHKAEEKWALPFRERFLSQTPWVIDSKEWLYVEELEAKGRFARLVTRGLLPPTCPLLLWGQEERSGSQRWGEELESRKRSQTLWEEACPCVLKDWTSGYTRDGTFFIFILWAVGWGVRRWGDCEEKSLYFRLQAIMYIFYLGHFRKQKQLKLWILITLPWNVEPSFKWRILWNIIKVILMHILKQIS